MRIVIVEDEASIREGMEGILKKMNAAYRIVGKAEDGKNGLACILGKKPDVVIMDIRMPDMDGLTMLGQLRKRGFTGRAIILSAYSDFSYAQKALELDVSSYLLKPVRVPELKRAFEGVEEEIREKNRQGMFLNLENIARSVITGILERSEETDLLLAGRYGIGKEERVAALGVWLGGLYEAKREIVMRILSELSVHTDGCRGVVTAFPEWRQCILIVYGMRDEKDWEDYFGRKALPILLSNTGGQAVGVWTEGRGFYALEECVKEGKALLPWNLSLGNECLLSRKRQQEAVCYPLKYPPGLSVKIKQTVIKKDRKEFAACFADFLAYCRKTLHHPRDIREACLTFLWTVLNTAQEYITFHENELVVQEILERLMGAVSWEEIRGCMADSFSVVRNKGLEQTGKSPLIQRAYRMMEEYYSQGITMEEVARKLSVTPEYLSRQYKKETGLSFTEEIRRIRMEKVKTLLVGTNLNLVRIAAMTGFSDSKYMSRVFREEVGVLPAEYRKMNR